jgi:uncharacterized protein YjdB
MRVPSGWRVRALLLATTALLSACDYEVTSTPSQEVTVGRISLPADSYTVRVGEVITIVATAYDHRGVSLSRLPDGGGFQWTSSVQSVAAVNDGIVTGLQPGRSIITVRGGGALAAARVGVVTGQ